MGERPSTGGRIKQHESDRARSKAWRDNRRRQREQAGSAPMELAGRPELAVAGLAAAAEAVRLAFGQGQEQMARQVEQVMVALELLTDPDAIDEALTLARAEASQQVARAEAAAAQARQGASQARQEAAEAEEAADAAVRELELADERAQQLESALAEQTAEVERLRQELEQQRAAHHAELQAVRDEAAQAQESAVTAARQELSDVLTSERAAHQRAAADATARVDELTTSLAQAGRELEGERARVVAAGESVERERAEHAAALARAEESATQRQESAVAAAREVLQERLNARSELLQVEKERAVELRQEQERLRRELDRALDRLDRVGVPEPEETKAASPSRRGRGDS